MSYIARKLLKFKAVHAMRVPTELVCLFPHLSSGETRLILHRGSTFHLEEFPVGCVKYFSTKYSARFKQRWKLQ